MNDPIIQFEIVLNYLNTLFTKAVAFKDKGSIEKLSLLEYEIYYGEDFIYSSKIDSLKKIEDTLQKYD